MERERESSGECSSIPNVRLAEYGRGREGTDARVLTDGGQAQLDEPEDESGNGEESTEEESAEDESEEADEDAESAEAEEEAESADQEAEGDDEESGAEEAAEEESEAEEEGEREGEEAGAEQVDEEEDTEAVEADEEDETEAGEEEADEAAEDEPEEIAEDEADEEPGHDVEDADQVYQSDETAGVAHLDLEGLFLDVLGLEVNLNEVTLDVSARPGENKLLGNLLSAVTGLLDEGSSMLEKVTALLSKPAEWVSGLLERPRELLGTLVRSPGQFLAGLFGFEPDAVDVGPLGDEETDDGEEAEGEADDETDADEGDEEASQGRLSAAISWLKEKLVSLIPGLPVEDLLATIIRETLRTLVDTLEESMTETGEEQRQEGEATEAAA